MRKLPSDRVSHVAACDHSEPVEDSRRVGFIARILLVPASATLMLLAADAARTQRTQERPVTVTGVAARRTSDGKTIYTLSADSRLDRAQTWQDGAGQHVVIVKGGSTIGKSLPPGVKVNRISESLEIVLPTGGDRRVSIQPRGDEIDFVVSGVAPAGAETFTARPEPAQRATSSRAHESKNSATAPNKAREAARRTPKVDAARRQPDVRVDELRASNRSTDVLHLAAPVVTDTTAQVAARVSSPMPAAPAIVNPVVAAAPAAPESAVLIPAPEQAEVVKTETTSAGAPFVYATGAGLCGALAFFFMRRRRQTDDATQLAEFFGDAAPAQPVVLSAAAASSKGLLGRGVFSKSFFGKNKDAADAKQAKPQSASAASKPAPAAKTRDAGKSKESGASAIESSIAPVPDGVRQTGAMSFVKPAAPVAAAVFGAYQVDQEVAKLVHGQAHRLDVLCSRAPEDRRAIETSLMKTLQTPEAGDAARRKAQQALEEYGFVARLCAGLLLAPSALDRVAAASTLGSINSATSLQFLIEALYDRDTSVRHAAVASLGSLRSPAAIGALLDIARRHADIPPALLTSALTACSVESLDFRSHGYGEPSRPAQIGAGVDVTGMWTGEITKLEPVETIVALPEWLDEGDDDLIDAFSQLDSIDPEARAAAARQLGQYPVARAVNSLSHLAACDPEAAVRAAAVTSLGALDHETVFEPIILRLVDEAREVRAAAARALSRLGFDRADAYARVIETADEESLRSIAAALAGAGMATQAVNRIVSNDRRQAYEAFSMLSLLVKAGEIQPLLDHIKTHLDTGVRLALVRLLGLSGGALYADRLEELARHADIPEQVRQTITETCEKIAHAEVF